jgi:hypothetical protein
MKEDTMSDPTPPAPAPLRPAVRRRAATRAQQLARFATDPNSITEAATALRVVNASFSAALGEGALCDAGGDADTRLCVHVNCVVDDARPHMVRSEVPCEIDVAVTMRFVPAPIKARCCTPNAKAA